MKPKTRSKSSRCLFCFGNCSQLQVSPLLKDEIPGAVHCTTLKRQLQNLFILRNILDIDASWCEETLRRRTEAEEEFKLLFTDIEENPSILRDNGNLEFWFKLCHNCILKVEEAWELYQKLLGIQTRINGIKEEIKETMKDGMEKYMRRSKGGVEDDIRKLVFPDFEHKRKVTFLDEVAFLETYSDDNMDEDFTPSKVESDDKEEVEREMADIGFRFRRKRGRPPKSMQNARSLISRRYFRRKRSGQGKVLDQSKKFKWWMCPQCDARYRDNNPEKISSHRERHKKSEETGGGEFDCPQCSFPAQDCLELDVHIRIKHINSITKKSLYVYDCPKQGCDFRARARKAMVEHTKEHHPDLNLTEEDIGGESNVLCSQCTRVFTSTRSLSSHQRAAHPHLIGAQKEELQCEECDLKFTSKIYLQAHINNTHKKEGNRFICDDCGRGFPFLSKLNRHKITHMNKTKREHVCHICGVDYAHKEILVKHLREIHGDAVVADQEAVKCRFCEFETPFRPALKKHMESHKEQMGFKCDKCSRCYTNAQGLKRHQRINHSDTQVACPYCNRKYPSVEYMKDHLKKFCKMRELKEQQQQDNSISEDPRVGFDVVNDIIVVSTTSQSQNNEIKRDGMDDPLAEVYQVSQTQPVAMSIANSNLCVIFEKVEGGTHDQG